MVGPSLLWPAQTPLKGDPMTKPAVLRCAIYTRKSSEEGLEQSFNSLDAQYEACEAYIASQRHEGWRLQPTRYDDGGFSGGHLERPGLQQLLTDIKAGRVDLVVVYKIDRLTRSLTDFSRMVEVFDQHKVSFVSVTQSFNTTTSMGRLTLNVLLSFAQFEREVTGERIRDKIAASKRKGMWMGGTVPMGYKSEGRTLVVIPDEAARVRYLFERYTVLGSVAVLRDETSAVGMVSKTRTSKAGQVSGAKPYSRGALYLLLKNRVYVGDIPHKDQVYPGHHEAIVPRELWDAVQTQLESNREQRRLGGRSKEASLLAGMVLDGEGQRLTPSHTVKAGRRYRYYLGRTGEPTKSTEGSGRARRICVPAHDLERLVTAEWQALLVAPDLDIQLEIDTPQISAMVRTAGQRLSQAWPDLSLSQQRRALLTAGLSVTVERTQLRLAFACDGLRALLDGTPHPLTRHAGMDDTQKVLRVVDAAVIRLYGETRILEEQTDAKARAVAPMHQALLRAIAQGRVWHQKLIAGEVDLPTLASGAGVSKRHIKRNLQCAWLAPDLIEGLLEGRASPRLSLASVRADFTIDWAAQRRLWA
jgi:site-specific DNA recombinase